MPEILEQLNQTGAAARLAALKTIIADEKEPPAALPQYANNHIHTTYSFSPYSPAAAVYFARAAGLQTAGIMDHDTIAGAREFIAAGELTGVATTIGLECRVSVAGTPLEGRRVNNPDQDSVAYMAIHGVPHTQIDFLQQVFAPLREQRNIRNRAMLDKINAMMSPFGIALDFEADILARSMHADGGCVTERHLLYALGDKMQAAFGRNGTAEILENKIGIQLTAKQKRLLTDGQNPYYDYDLLGVLKSGLVEQIYVPATAELMHISELVALAGRTGALLCYSYLGDVGESVTGDKKSQAFEDSYLDLLFDVIARLGIRAVTYMPSRNNAAQLERLQRLCREMGMIEISGEDINSPRQSYICPQLAQPRFSHLIAATWNLIEREKAETLRQLGAKRKTDG
ncbi:MAG TPA: PHP domain-containing protein [Clostridiales bacterium]|nr:MAG: PHP domain protein [Firmicutes bacterium ADurb.Bin262]HQK73706.1 PHP domain-containing protein [Clostridiales bacterium]